MHIYEYLNSLVGDKFSSNKELPFPVEEVHFKKNSIITKYGDIENKAYFLIDGLVQGEIVKNDGSEFILDFVFPNTFVNAYISFIKQEPTAVQISAVTDCVVEVIDCSKIKDSYNDSLLMNQAGRIITEARFVQKTQLQIDFLTKSAQERYIELFKSHPQIIKEIPINKIAKYLGIHPESLSRIRKELFS